MSDMINRDEVLAIIADLKKDYPTHSVPDAEAKVALRKVADKIRAIDAVSVVRCKECKHRTYCYGEVHMTNKRQTVNIHKDIDFCSYGEREGE